MKARKECPRLLRPSGIIQRVMAAAFLVRQLRVAELDRPLLDVETELRIVDVPKRSRSACAT
jgi:hypothetical protein